MTLPKRKRLGIVLSGGGIRAAVFHLGMLKYLASRDRLSEVHHISSVSGGSICAALVLSHNEMVWPENHDTFTKVFDAIKRSLTTVSIQKAYLLKLIFKPWAIFRGRANMIEEVLRDQLNVRGFLHELPENPKLVINSTSYLTGKGWRFSKEKMGDYQFGYVRNPKLSLAGAVAASAAYPVLIGPYYLTIEKSKDRSSEKAQKLALWDGGVYENTGLENVFKNQSLQHDLEFLIVCDASPKLGRESRRWKREFPFYTPIIRLINITMDQVRSLRARAFVGMISENKNGVYLQIGVTTSSIFKAVGRQMPSAYSEHFDAETCALAASLPTSLKCLSEDEFDLLVEHGRQVAEATINAYIDNEAERLDQNSEGYF